MIIKTIASNTFKEVIRDKILYNIFIFALFILGLSYFVGNLSFVEHERITLNFGLAVILFSGIVIAIFIGVSLLSKELSKKTIYTVLSKPIHRYEFVIGKFLGLSWVLTINMFIMGMVLFLLLRILGADVNFIFIQSIYFYFIETLLVTAVAILFSSFTTMSMSVVFSISIVMIGHLVNDIKYYGEKSTNQWIQILADILYYLLPNFSNFNLNQFVVYNQTIGWEKFFSLSVYGILYIGLVLYFSILIFRKREFI